MLNARRAEQIIRTFVALGCFIVCLAGWGFGQDADRAEPEVLPRPAEPEAATDPEPFNNDPSVPLPELPVRTVPGQPGSWNEASTDRRQVSEVIRAQWVSLDRLGRLIGRVSVVDPDTLNLLPVEGLQVGFLREGQTLGRTQTDASGNFIATGLQPGVYTLVASGPRGFMAYSLSVLSFAQAQRQAALALQNPIQFVQLGGIQQQLEIDAAAVPPTFNNLTRLVRRYYPDVRVSEVTADRFEQAIQRDIQQQVPGANAPGGPMNLRGITELEQNRPQARDATSIRQHEVLLAADGTMLGRLHSIDQLTGRPKQVEDVNVFLLRDDRLVAQVRVNNLGIFEVKNLVPGSYGMVAAGRGGFGAVGFKLAMANQAAPGAGLRNRDDLFQFAVRRDPVPFQLVQNAGVGNMAFPFSMSLVDDPRNIRAAFALSAQQQVPLAQNGAPPVPPVPPAAPMGGNGGGGNNGGFSNGGGLLAAAAIASAIALPLALSGDDSVELVSPFSPQPPPDAQPVTPPTSPPTSLPQ